jgi:hypothetical protein
MISAADPKILNRYRPLYAGDTFSFAQKKIGLPGQA